MSFVSLAFIAYALAVGCAYFAVPSRWRWAVLLVASYLFFFLNSHWLVLALFAQTLASFLVARRIQRLVDVEGERGADGAASKRRRKVLARLGVALNIGALLLMKYFNFFAESGNAVLAAIGLQIPTLPLVVPIGMSFYTLQAVAYIVDVNRKKTRADVSLPRFMLFMSYFPQILQGPIPRHSQLAHQLYEGHRFDYRNLCQGAQLMLWGFAKKLIIADCIALPVNQLFDNYLYYDGPILFLAAAGYGLQVYADFSGGVDIARGFSQALGIDLVENFRQPYFSKSIEEFWRRWHITLGAWMRDYVFYPLSLSKAFSRLGKRARKVFGSSVGKRIPPFVSMFVVFFCVGFWHGANWTFIAYGLWNGVFIAAGVLFGDTLYQSAKRKLHVNEEAWSWRMFQMLRTFVICSLGRFFSRSATLTQALRMMKRALFDGVFNLSFLVDGTMLSLGLNYETWGLLCVAILVMFGVDAVHERGIAIREWLSCQNAVFRWAVYLGGIAAVLVFGVYGGNYGDASFIYQQF